MTKVLEVVTAMADGGAETLVKDYACLIDKQHFDVKILCIYNLSNTANAIRIKDNQIDVLSIFKDHGIISRLKRKLIGNYFIPFKLKEFILREKPDAIHIHLSLLKYFVGIIDALEGINLFFTCHSVPSRVFGGQNIEEFYAAQKLIKERGLRLIALHEEMAQELNEMFGISNTIIIKNGVDFRRFRCVRQKKDELRSLLNIPRDALVLGHIGRFIASKNQMFLLDIFNEIIKKHSNSFLLLIGWGDMKKDIIEKIHKLGLEENVIILSHRTDIPELLKVMDVFVFPSLYEGLSVTLVEAQVVGLKCVVSDGINKESILSSQTIIVSLESSVKNWVDAILDKNIVNDKYGNIEEFDLNLEMRKLEKLYSS